MEGTHNNSARRQHQKPLNAGLTYVVGWTPIVTATSSNKRTTQKKTKQHNLIQTQNMYMHRYAHTSRGRVYIYSYGGSSSRAIESWCCCVCL